jgi:uncharacterized protein (TIGR03066 family)
MTGFRTPAALAIACTFACGIRADEKDYPRLIVGKWEAVKSVSKNDLPAGPVVEFTKDGRVKVTVKEDGREEAHAADHKLEGSKLTLVHESRSQVKKATIKRLAEKEPSTEGGRGSTELRRQQ